MQTILPRPPPPQIFTEYNRNPSRTRKGELRKFLHTKQVEGEVAMSVNYSSLLLYQCFLVLCILIGK